MASLLGYDKLGARLVRPGAVAVALLIGAAIPFFLPLFPLRVAILALIYAILALSLGVLMGYAGMESLGQAAFFGVGAYTVGILTVSFGATWWIAALVALILSTLVAIIVGAVSVRLTGLFFLVMTLAFGQVLWGSAHRWGDLSGGTLGVHGIPRPQAIVQEDGSFYYVVLFFFVATIILLLRLVRSPFGLSLRGIRDQELRMRSTGYNVWLHKFLAFTVCGALSGLAGILLAFFNQFVSPSVLAVRTSFDAMLMVIIGGSGTLLGPVIGAALIMVLRNYLGIYVNHWIIILGLVYIATVLYAPKGILGALHNVRSRVWRRDAGMQSEAGDAAGRLRRSDNERSTTRSARGSPGGGGTVRSGAGGGRDGPLSRPTSGEGEALRMEGLTRRFGMLTALNDVSVTIEAGARVGVLGPNGAGKTTLFNLVTGDFPPTAGEVFLFGERITDLPTYMRTRKGLGRTYQLTRLYPTLSVVDNVRLGVLGLRSEKYRMLQDIGSLAPVNERALELLQFAGLHELREVEVRHLSYGHQRQLELVVALACEPRVLLLDEPAAGLSVAETQPMVELISSLGRNLTLLIIEHDMDVAFEVAERILVLHEGKLLTEGSPEEVKNNPQVREVYLGSFAL